MQIQKNFYNFVYLLTRKLVPKLNPMHRPFGIVRIVIGDLATRTKRVFPIFKFHPFRQLRCRATSVCTGRSDIAAQCLLIHTIL